MSLVTPQTVRPFSNDGQNQFTIRFRFESHRCFDKNWYRLKHYMIRFTQCVIPNWFDSECLAMCFNFFIFLLVGLDSWVIVSMLLRGLLIHSHIVCILCSRNAVSFTCNIVYKIKWWWWWRRRDTHEFTFPTSSMTNSLCIIMQIAVRLQPVGYIGIKSNYMGLNNNFVQFNYNI